MARVWWVKVPVDLLEAALPWQAKSLHIFLLSRCSPGTNRLSASQIKLARALGIHRDTLRKYLGILVDSGWLSMEGGNHGETTFVVRNPVLEERQAEVARVRKRIDRTEHKGEALMREWLNLIVDSDDFDDNARPGFLRNPMTGENMEYDRWYTAGVAFEFNGPQHYGPTDVYPDPAQARLTMGRDYIKRGISQEKGVHLVTIRPDDLTFTRMRKLVEGLLPLRELRPDDPVLRYLTEVSLRYMGRARAAQQHRPSR